MDSILSKLGGDNRFDVYNKQKYILVLGMTGVGKSTLVNFMTDRDKENGGCEVSDSSSPCTAEYKLVDCVYYCGSAYRTLSFIDTPGLDDPNGDKKNIEEIIKFRNAFPRINTIIYCQKLDDNRFNQSAKVLFNLMKDLYPDPNLFKNVLIVRTKSDRNSRDFEDNKKASLDFIRKIKEEYKLDDGLQMHQYYIDSKYKDDDSLNEKINILDLISKMDPIFKGIKILNIDEVIIYDSLNNKYEIKEKRNVEYIDYDGSKSTKVETDTEIQNFDGNKVIKVEVYRTDTGKSKYCLWCKQWKIIYRIYHIKKQNQEEFFTEIPVYQRERNEDISNRLKMQEEKRLIKEKLMISNRS